MLIVADSLIVANAAPWLRYGAALVLLAFLPGWAWLAAVQAHQLHPVEQITLAAGLSLALTILAAMLAVYLPGPLAGLPLLLIVNGISLAGLGLAWRQGRSDDPAGQARLPSPWLLLAVLLILAGLLRLPGLGYPEFHEDEAEALMLGVRLMQGEDYALFLHRKGPAQMLAPVAFWLLAGHMTEAWARLPFALSSIASVAVLFFLGRRWFSWQAGVLAGLLWAVSGYSLAFGRMVQYQALIFFLGPLALLCLELARQQRRWLPAAAVLLAACLLAHFDALLLLPAAGYLGWQAVRNRSGTSPALLALLILAGALAAFYVPYVLDPEFRHTAAYLAESRVRPGLLYNNLSVLQELDATYSSPYYLPLLTFGLLLLIVRQSAALPRTWRWLSGGLCLLAVSTWAWPDLWRAGASSLALLPWLLLGIIFIRFAPGSGQKAAWLMSGAPLVGYVFLVDDPRTHLYIMYPGLALLSGAGWAMVWPAWRPAGAGLLPRLFRLSASLFVLATGVIILYESLIFLQRESALTRIRNGWDGSWWERVYDDLPGERDYFGYPRREGWKVVGALRAQGQLPGDFRSMNEDFIVPIWYNYGEARSCYTTPAHYFVRAPGRSFQTDEILAGYAEVGQVQREGETRLHLLAAGPAPAAPAVYSLEAFEPAFDRLATPEQFIRQAEPTQPVGALFGPAIRFAGYDLPQTTVRPGETLYVNLYWQALQPPQASYRAFVHLTDGTRLWSQQDDDPICRLPTAIWRTGQRGRGQFRLALPPDTPPGRYPLIIGLYRADTLERLKITGGAGQVGDDFLWLGDIEVVAGRSG